MTDARDAYAMPLREFIDHLADQAIDETASLIVFVYDERPSHVVRIDDDPAVTYRLIEAAAPDASRAILIRERRNDDDGLTYLVDRESWDPKA